MEIETEHRLENVNSAVNLRELVMYTEHEEGFLTAGEPFYIHLINSLIN